MHNFKSSNSYREVRFPPLQFKFTQSFGIHRYGNLFKTHILGSPTVVCMDPELNRYILMNEGKGLVPGYPQSMQDLMGKWNISAVHGSLHKSMRSAMLGLIGPNMIKDQLISEIDEFLKSYLSNWSGKVIDIQEKTKEVGRTRLLKQLNSFSSRHGFRNQYSKSTFNFNN